MIKSIIKVNHPVTYFCNGVVNKGVAIEERLWGTGNGDSLGVLVKWDIPIEIGCNTIYEEFFHTERLKKELIFIN